MNDLQHRRRLRRKVEARLADLEIPKPFDLDALCERLAARRGRPILLRPTAMGSGPCGLWADVGGVDYIVFERETTPLHKEQIVLHEVGHLLAEHSPRVTDHESIALLMPDLDPDMVRRVMGRHGYTSEEEQEAELLASLVLERAGRTKPARSRTSSAESSRALDVLGAVLEGGAHK